MRKSSGKLTGNTFPQLLSDIGFATDKSHFILNLHEVNKINRTFAPL
jgi:hypothetical protein